MRAPVVVAGNGAVGFWAIVRRLPKNAPPTRLGQVLKRPGFPTKVRPQRKAKKEAAWADQNAERFRSPQQNQSQAILQGCKRLYNLVQQR